MIESRRCPSATPASGSDQKPEPHGPRCASRSVIAETALRVSGSTVRGSARRPAMPHMSASIVDEDATEGGTASRPPGIRDVRTVTRRSSPQSIRNSLHGITIVHGLLAVNLVSGTNPNG